MSDFLGTDLMQLLARSQSSGASNPLAELQGQGQAPDKTSADLLAALQQKREVAMAQANEQVEPEKMGIGQTLALALANAGSTYAAGINPNLKQQDFVNPAIALRERRARRETAAQQSKARTVLDDLTRQDALIRSTDRRNEDRDFATKRDELNRAAQAEQNRLSREAQAKQNELNRAATIEREDVRWTKRMQQLKAEQGAAAAQKFEEAANNEDRTIFGLRNEFLIGDERMQVPPLIDLLIAEGQKTGSTPGQIRNQILTVARQRTEAIGGRPATVERVLQTIESVLRDKLPDETVPGRDSFGPFGAESPANPGPTGLESFASGVDRLTGNASDALGSVFDKLFGEPR